VIDTRTQTETACSSIVSNLLLLVGVSRWLRIHECSGAPTYQFARLQVSLSYTKSAGVLR